MKGFSARDISLTVVFLTLIWKLGMGSTAEARDKQFLFTVCKNMTRLSQRKTPHVWTRKLERHLHIWERNMKKLTQTQEDHIVMINHHFQASICTSIAEIWENSLKRDKKWVKAYLNHLENQ